ncbi:hypothetical protein OHC33_010271 [Knufia fluminis]|uniref:Heterokaryon incompatibility domain-containing protein n=1 Tax=Knufia fluminis TaxID=191047 RepID=A0AAN8ED75_9EURO|nr:hypothetical protein OHC33_010271 [Knufia fluminis]
MEDPPPGFEAFLERWLFWGSLENILKVGYLKVKDYRQPDGNGGYCIRIAEALSSSSVPARLRLHIHYDGLHVHRRFLTPRNTKPLPDSVFAARSSTSQSISLYDFCLFWPDKLRDRRNKPLIWATSLLHQLAQENSAAKTTTAPASNHNADGSHDSRPLDDTIPQVPLSNAPTANTSTYETSDPNTSAPGTSTSGDTFMDANLLALKTHIAKWLVDNDVEREAGARERLLDLGWCPWEAYPLAERFQSPFCFYISQMAAPEAQKSHHGPTDSMSIALRLRNGSIPDKPLGSCTEKRCQWKTVSQSTYVTAHLNHGTRQDWQNRSKRNCGGCMEVTVDAGELDGILRSEGLPLLSVRSTQSTGGQLQLTTYHKHNRPKYVAFSHVWSDSLGNLTGNSLPLCQIERLERLVLRVNTIRQRQGLEPLYEYWLDTLCVPPDAAEKPDVQTLAIHKMRETYADAEVVVVLDKWLVESSVKSMTRIEKLARVVCSPWMRRLWTLQEGLLARPHGLGFVSGNSIFNADGAVHLFAHENHPRGLVPIVEQALLRYGELRHASWARLLDSQHMEPNNTVWNPERLYILFKIIIASLKFRSTSVATDEALYLSVLLNLDAKEISATSPHLRMLKIWSSLPTVPMSILVWTLRRFSGIPGLRWAPSTFLDPRSTFGRGPTHLSTYLRASAIATVTDAGLRVQVPGVLFCASRTQIAQHNLQIECGPSGSFIIASLLLQAESEAELSGHASLQSLSSPSDPHLH